MDARCGCDPHQWHMQSLGANPRPRLMPTNCHAHPIHRSAVPRAGCARAYREGARALAAGVGWLGWCGDGCPGAVGSPRGSMAGAGACTPMPFPTCLPAHPPALTDQLTRPSPSLTTHPSHTPPPPSTGGRPGDALPEEPALAPGALLLCVRRPRPRLSALLSWQAAIPSRSGAWPPPKCWVRQQVSTADDCRPQRSCPRANDPPSQPPPVRRRKQTPGLLNTPVTA